VLFGLGSWRARVLLIIGACSCVISSGCSEQHNNIEQRGVSGVNSPLEIHLLVTSTRFSMQERDRFRLGLTATNTTDTAIDPHLFGVRLLVNGTPSPAFDLKVGNAMPVKWDNLPAGETTPQVDWPLGKALFTEPGKYELVLQHQWGNWQQIESSAIVVVTP